MLHVKEAGLIRVAALLQAMSTGEAHHSSVIRLHHLAVVHQR